ncbi:MAG: carbamate kinase [Candidatus Thermoplasmatota archaeon]|jgi:carbamate kinase|nr:carbamate kinase [Candidatus Thermoplasmatota archaeon]
MQLKNKSVVVALGGNAITRPGVPDTIANQFRHTRESLPPIIKMAEEGYRMVVTHGNGPQVGNALLRVENSLKAAPDLPLGVLVADTEGGIGYMIEQSLQNGLMIKGVKRDIATMVTQVVVDRDDPSVEDPNKFVGQFYGRDEALKLSNERGWVVKEDKGRGWRRVVPSPMPRRIINSRIIRELVSSGVIVIAAGGGGIPVFYEDDGRLEGMDAVIDKDRASAVLGIDIGAHTLLIMTEADGVYVNFRKKDQMRLARLTVEEAKELQAKGEFPPGSMGPKIEAAIAFLEGGGKKVIISSIKDGYLALEGQAGTTII